MTIFNSSSVNSNTLISQVVSPLLTLRDALNAVADLYGWTSGISATDLENLGLSVGDATALLAAVADANAMAQIYLTGLPPGSYPQPASAYVYSASQRSVIGPQA